LEFGLLVRASGREPAAEQVRRVWRAGGGAGRGRRWRASWADVVLAQRAALRRLMRAWWSGGYAARGRSHSTARWLGGAKSEAVDAG
jgi:hypothetical protein